MADINRVVLVGRLTRDAELKYTATGQAVCKFSVAVNRRRKNGDQWEEEASYFDVVVWGRSGESLNQYLLKGKAVGIDGELRQDRWQQDGQNRSKVEIVASNIQLLGGSQGSNGPGGGSQGGNQGFLQPRNSPANSVGNGSGEGSHSSSSDDDFTDDIPF
ncbi:MAG: single-stranded DNA-binding protein [Treponema sp.]|jgi:single-strand DNA-binding protein|nr:single-stranded DNA-binding protein [Treponema sp.]